MPTFTKTDAGVDSSSITPIDTSALKLVRGGGPNPPTFTVIKAGLGTSSLTPISVAAIQWMQGYTPVVSANFLTAPTLPPWVSFSVGGTGSGAVRMQFDSAGKLTYAPNNLLTYSNAPANVAWGKTNATVSGSVVTTVSTGSASNTGQSVSLVAGTTYLVTATVSAGNVNRVLVGMQYDAFAYSDNIFDLSSQTWSLSDSGAIAKGYTALGGGVYQLWIVRTAVTSASRLGVYVGAINSAGATVSSTTAGNTVNLLSATVSAVTYETTPRAADQVITTSAAYYGPRFDYDPDTLAPRGLGIWQSYTQYALNSGDLSNASWSVVGVGRTPNAAVSPDGRNTATALDFPAGIVRVSTNNSVFYNQGIYNTSGVATGGFWLKAKTPEDVGKQLYLVHADQYLNNVNQRTITLTGGWKFYGLTTNAAWTVGYVFLTVDIYAGMTGSPLPAVGVYGWGGQRTNTAFEVPYVETGASAVTVAADVVQLAGAALTTLQGAKGSFLAETALAANDTSTYQGVLSVNGVSSVPAYWLANPKKASSYNASSVLSAANTLDLTQAQRIGLAWSAAGRSIVGSGGTVASDAASTFGGAFTIAYLGADNSSHYLNGYIRSLAIYNVRLPDATLKAKSVVGAAY